MKRIMRLGQIIAALSICLASQTQAATPPPSARISAEEVGHGGPACGITESSATSAIRAAMRYNRIAEEYRPKTEAFEIVPTIYFSGNVAKVGVQCVGNYDIQFQVFGPIPVPWAPGDRMVGKVVFCSAGGFAGGSTATFATDYLNGLKRAFDSCLSKMASFTVSAR